ADGLEILGQQERPGTQARRHRSRLGPRMPPANHQNVERIHPGKTRGAPPKQTGAPWIVRMPVETGQPCSDHQLAGLISRLASQSATRPNVPLSTANGGSWVYRPGKPSGS